MSRRLFRFALIVLIPALVLAGCAGMKTSVGMTTNEGSRTDRSESLP